jgi:hypothetical protein
VKLCPNSNKHPRSTQGASFRSHAWSAYQRVQISQGLPINVPNHLLYAQCRVQIRQGLSIDDPNHLLYAQHRVQISQGLLIDVPNNFLYFLHVHHCIQKVRGSRSTHYTASITFSTCITTYKKQWALDRRSIQLLLFSAHASLRIKSKGLHRYVLHI